jgi:hypothetical protein
MAYLRQLLALQLLERAEVQGDQIRYLRLLAALAAAATLELVGRQILAAAVGLQLALAAPAWLSCAIPTHLLFQTPAVV